MLEALETLEIEDLLLKEDKLETEETLEDDWLETLEDDLLDEEWLETLEEDWLEEDWLEEDKLDEDDGLEMLDFVDPPEDEEVDLDDSDLDDSDREENVSSL